MVTGSQIFLKRHLRSEFVNWSILDSQNFTPSGKPSCSLSQYFFFSTLNEHSVSLKTRKSDERKFISLWHIKNKTYNMYSHIKLPKRKCREKMLEDTSVIRVYSQRTGVQTWPLCHGKQSFWKETVFKGWFFFYSFHSLLLAGFCAAPDGMGPTLDSPLMCRDHFCFHKIVVQKPLHDEMWTLSTTATVLHNTAQPTSQVSFSCHSWSTADLW